MPQLLRHTLISVRDLAFTTGPFVLLAVALAVGAYWFLDPTPPKRLVLATGPDQSAYAEFGKRYREELKRYGIEVVLLPTAGSSDNLRRLRDAGQRVDAAFVQGGSSDALYAVDESRAGPPLVSLGSLFLEPLWLFYRDDVRAPAAARGPLVVPRPAPITQWRDWQGLAVNIGTEGSGVPNLFAKLLQANRIEPQAVKLSYLAETPAVVAFLDKKLDGLMFASAPESPMVQMLVMTPGVRLFEFVQNEAYARRFPFLTAVSLPRGIADLERDIPNRDVPLVATTTSLVARDALHPALMQLLVQAARSIHGGPSWFNPAGRYPSPATTEWPLAKEAARYYKDGPPLLQRYLPFWLANLVDRMWVVILSLVAVLLPLSRVVPPVYEFRVRSRIFRWYAQLRAIEAAAVDRSRPAADLLDELDGLDGKVGRIPVPLSHAEELYTLRAHIALVRARLQPASGVPA